MRACVLPTSSRETPHVCDSEKDECESNDADESQVNEGDSSFDGERGDADRKPEPSREEPQRAA
jgi:hypothetical protein